MPTQKEIDRLCEVTENFSTMIVAVSGNCYWGKGTSVERAFENLRKEGCRGVQNVLVYSYTGPKEDLETIRVDGIGNICYPQNCLSIRVGMLKLNVSTQLKP